MTAATNLCVSFDEKLCLEMAKPETLRRGDDATLRVGRCHAQIGLILIASV